METDHINHNRLDNRRFNLRICNRAQNNINRIITNKRGIKGVFVTHNNKNPWGAQISFNNKNYNLGHFKTIEEAGEAYKKKAKELFGEFVYKETMPFSV